MKTVIIYASILTTMFVASDIINYISREELMDNSLITELNKGFTAAFIDSSYNSALALKPEFLSNDYKLLVKNWS